MASRRAEDQADSLELLLDTICNAFGGILFLTILLTILLRLSHPKGEQKAVSEPARHEMIELASQLEASLAELESLERSLGIQENTRARLTDVDLETRYENLEQLRHRRQEVELAILETNQAAAQTQQQIDAADARHEALTRDLGEAKDEVAATNKKLDAERKRRTQSVVPPHGRSTEKRELTVIVRYGRAYFPDRWDRSQTAREPNLDDFVLLGESSRGLRLTPKPYRGLAIEDPQIFGEQLRRMLETHDPGRWYVCLAVWEDTFERFPELKKLLIQWGYEMRILALANGKILHETFVPDPQVQ